MVDESVYPQEPTDRPPTALDVGRRALILSSVVCRVSIERDSDETYKRQTAADIDEWLDDLGLWPHLEPDEEELLRAPLGEMTQRLQIRGTWFAEGLSILSWALHRSEFPPHDRKVDAVAVTNDLDFLHQDAKKLLESPTLRDTVELEAVREWFYDLHCSLRCYLKHGGDGHLASWIGDDLHLLGIDPADVMIDGRIAFRRRRVEEVGRKELQDWESVVCERHRASIWLRGYDEPFTELPVDT